MCRGCCLALVTRSICIAAGLTLLLDSSVLRLLFSPGGPRLLWQCRLGLLMHPGRTLLLCHSMAEASAGQPRCAMTDAGLRLPLAEALDLGHSVALPPLNTNRTHFEGKPRILVAVTSSSTSDVVSALLQPVQT